MAESSLTVDEQDGDRAREGRSIRKGRVKRPMNAFMIWGRAERRRLAAENPTTPNGDLSRILGQRWNAMSDDEREPFLVEAERLRMEHRQKNPGYKYSPRPPRRRLVVDSTPGHQKDRNSMFTRLTRRSMKVDEVKYSSTSRGLVSTLQQCSVSDLLDAIASHTAHQFEYDSDITAKGTSCLDHCEGLNDALHLDLESFQLSSPLSDDLLDINLSPLVNEEQGSMRVDTATNPFAIGLSNNSAWDLGKLAAPYDSLTASSATNVPCSRYPHPRDFCHASWLSDSQKADTLRYLYGESCTLPAAGQSSHCLSSSSLVGEESLDSWISYSEYACISCKSSPTTSIGYAQDNMFSTSACAGRPSFCSQLLSGLKE